MLWIVEQCDLWGDLGQPLISGFARRQSPDDPLRLNRAGPFLPPISFPWLPVGGTPIVVSDAFRRTLEARQIPHVQFRTVIKDCIVKLPWHEWDRTVKKPGRYPQNEPEDYIQGKKHHAATAAQMPAAWELLPPVVPLRTERKQNEDGSFNDNFWAYGDRDDYPGFFADRADNYAKLVVDDPTRQWLQRDVGEWVKFCEVELVRAEPVYGPPDQKLAS